MGKELQRMSDEFNDGAAEGEDDSQGGRANEGRCPAAKRPDTRPELAKGSEAPPACAATLCVVES